MRIGLVDDNPVNRSNFMQKVAQFIDLDVSLTAINGHEFLEKLKGLPLIQQPVVVFMDIQMPQLNGIDTIKLAKALYPSIHFIVLTVFEDDDNIFEAIQAGASGYLLKHESHHTIREAIDEILEYGGAPMSPAIARKTLKLLGQKNLAEQKEKAKNNESVLENLLSEREREVLTHTVNGYDAKRIAEITGISTLTVRKHIANIYTKLHVNSKAQVISLAHKNNWIKVF
ncbi:MAG TPA: response regulator transcription factor [Bacteroidia bacterium]|nr:response regulator transcription factor [Bacteroidia bacterium]HNU32355.1 response regulator transcription factor [Bacteroidia bacterium]